MRGQWPLPASGPWGLMRGHRQLADKTSGPWGQMRRRRQFAGKAGWASAKMDKFTKQEKFDGVEDEANEASTWAAESEAECFYDESDKKVIVEACYLGDNDRPPYGEEWRS